MRTSRLIASATVGGLTLLGFPAITSAQRATGSPVQLVGQVAALVSGSIHGQVQDEQGSPVAGAMVSALGATTAFAVTDRNGRFELRTLPPGPYQIRAHSRGYVSARAQMVDVRASARTASTISLRRGNVLAAGFGAGPAPATESIGTAGDPEWAPDDANGTADPQPDAAGTPGYNDSNDNNDNHGETAWWLRHARRGILKDATIPDDLVAEQGTTRGPVDFLARAVGSPARVATSFFVDTPFSGQVNLLTSGSFETPQQLFAGELNHGIAYLRLGAAAGAHADWVVRGAFTQADISSWILAGSYATKTSARHQYDIGLSYSTQRYDGGNPLALREVTDGSRNVGTVYGFDTFAITPALSLTYGAHYARYDYLDDRSLLSPRLEVTMTPADRLRLTARLSRQAHAPGAEEFLPPGDTGIWLPPQRTFSSLEPDRALQAERTTNMAVVVERDIAASTLTIRAFRQRVDAQLVTLFGAEAPSGPIAKLGHYFVGNAGDVDAAGGGAGFRTLIGGRVHGSIDYSITTAQLLPAEGLRYLILLAPSAVRPAPERIHDVATSIETEVPETATRLLVLYRMSSAFARPSGATGTAAGSPPGFDARFDVQVRQSLPFLNFTSAKWEMLIAVRNFFRETSVDQSVYDELLVVRPPKRIVGGVTLNF